MPQLEGGRWAAKIWHNSVSEAASRSCFFNFGCWIFRRWQLGNWGYSSIGSCFLFSKSFQVKFRENQAFVRSVYWFYPFSLGWNKDGKAADGRRVPLLGKEGVQDAGGPGKGGPAGPSREHSPQMLYLLCSKLPGYSGFITAQLLRKQNKT